MTKNKEETGKIWRNQIPEELRLEINQKLVRFANSKTLKQRNVNEKHMYKLFVQALTQAEQRTIKEIINKLESEGVDTPLGKLTPQEIDFVIAKIKI